MISTDIKKLIEKIEKKAIYLARQIEVIDRNFFNNNKTIFQAYDFLDKFVKYTFEGKILSQSSLIYLSKEKLFKLELDIDSLNKFLLYTFPYEYKNKEILNFFNNELKNIVNIFISDKKNTEIKNEKRDPKEIDIEVHKSKLKAINLTINNIEEEISKLNSITDARLILRKKEVLEIEIEKKESIKKDLKDSIQYSKDQTKINNAIQKLNRKAEQLVSSKDYYEEQRDIFNRYYETSFKIVGAMFGLYVVSCYVFYLFNPSSLNIKDINFVFYLLLVFPIIFPTIIGFLFVHQSNVKSKELNKLNDKYILIHDVNNSISALLEINKGININEKAEKILYKLIDNILNNNFQLIKDDNLNNDVNLINSRIDNSIDSIEKKKSFFKWFNY